MNNRHLDKDVIGGLLMLVIALIGGLMSFQYPAGSTSLMGPGYVPRVLCGALGFVAVLILIGGLRREDDEEAGVDRRFAPELVPLVFVVGSMVLFAFVIDWLGLLASVLLLVMVANGVTRKYRVIETVLVAVVLSVATALVFVEGLGLPIPLWPEPFR